MQYDEPPRRDDSDVRADLVYSHELSKQGMKVSHQWNRDAWIWCSEYEPVTV